MQLQQNEIRALFFGCWGESGHYMFLPNKSILDEQQCEQLGFPCGFHLDGSYLFLPRPEIKDHGRLTYLAAPHVTVLSWWNDVWDSRGRVNSHFIMRGELSVSSMWHMFHHTFPDVWAHHKKPYISVTY